MPRIATFKERLHKVWYDTYIFGTNANLERKVTLFNDSRFIGDLSRTNLVIPGQFGPDQTFVALGWRIQTVLSPKLEAAVRRSLTFEFFYGEKPCGKELIVGTNNEDRFFVWAKPIVIPVRMACSVVLEWVGDLGDFEMFRDSEETKCLRVEIGGVSSRDVR